MERINAAEAARTPAFNRKGTEAATAKSAPPKTFAV